MFYDGGYMMGGMHGLWWLFLGTRPQQLNAQGGHRGP